MNHSNTPKQVVDIANEEWAMHVEEPPNTNWQRIDQYIQGPQGLGWSWIAKSWEWVKGIYSKNRQFEWCGAFAAFCYGAAGLSAHNRRKHLAGCTRLYRWSGGRRGNDRRIKPRDITFGDIVVVGKKKGSVKGSHITICSGVGRRGIKTIEGNAYGRLPDGEYGEGVIKRSRPFRSGSGRKVVLYGVRPLVEDYE
jgi:hypothetical protein